MVPSLSDAKVKNGGFLYWIERWRFKILSKCIDFWRIGIIPTWDPVPTNQPNQLIILDAVAMSKFWRIGRVDLLDSSHFFRSLPIPSVLQQGSYCMPLEQLKLTHGLFFSRTRDLFVNKQKRAYESYFVSRYWFRNIRRCNTDKVRIRKVYRRFKPQWSGSEVRITYSFVFYFQKSSNSKLHNVREMMSLWDIGGRMESLKWSLLVESIDSSWHFLYLTEKSTRIYV